MKTPRLNRKLVLEAPQQTADGAGGFTETWVPLGTLWAAVQPGSGSDAQSAELSVSTVSFRITVRAAPDGAPSRPVAGQRFVDGARVYGILAVAEAGARAQYLTCFAREEVAT